MPFLAAVARSILRRRAAWVVGVSLALLLSGSGASRLVLRQDLNDFLTEPPADAGRISPDLLRELSDDRLAIVLEADDSIETRDIERVFGYLAPALRSLPGIRGVLARSAEAQSRFLQQHLPGRIALYLSPGVLATVGERLSRSGLEARLLSGGRDPLGLFRLAAQPMRAWQGVARLRAIDGFLALPGGKTFFLLIDPAGPVEDIDQARRLVRSIDRVLQQARDAPALAPVLAGRRLYATGQLVSGVSTVNALQADGIRVAAAVSVAVVFLLLLFFRSVAAPLAILATVTVGLLITAGAAGFAVGSVGLLAWMFSGLLVGLGDDYAVYVCTQYWVHGSVDAGREAALIEAVTRPGPGITMGALTSASGFLSLILIPYTWTREVGVLSALGLLMILGCSLTFLPLLLSFFRPKRKPTMSVPWERLADRMAKSRPPVAALPWIILVGAAVLVLPTLNFQAHPWRIIARGDRESARLERLSTEAGAGFSPILIVSTGATPEEAIERDRDAVLRLRAVSLRAGVAAIQSLAQWLPAPDSQRANLAYLRAHSDLFDPNRVRRDFAAVLGRMEQRDPYLTGEYLPRILGALHPPREALTLADLRSLGLGEQVDRHLRQHDGANLAVSYVYLRRHPFSEGVTPRFMAVAREAGLTSLAGVMLAGAPLRAQDTAVIWRAVGRAVLLATLLVGGLLWLRFRRFSLVLLCLTPLLCGLSAAVLTIPLLGIEFNLLSAAIAPILVGTGVDDGIHMVGRLQAGDTVATVLREAGSSLVMTTLTTVAAFACLGLATFTGIREAGLLGCVGLMGSLLAAIHLVPLGWQILGNGAARG